MAKSSRTIRRRNSLPKLIEKYYADLADLARQNVLFEMGTRPAFHALLQAVGKEHGWTLIAEQEKKVGGKTIRPDGTFKDQMNLVRGYWEAKDTDDKLDAEIEKKRKAGYPLNNIIFDDTATAILYQPPVRADLWLYNMSAARGAGECCTTFSFATRPKTRSRSSVHLPTHCDQQTSRYGMTPFLLSWAIA